MIPEPRTIAAPKAMTFDRLLEKIRYEGFLSLGPSPPRRP